MKELKIKFCENKEEAKKILLSIETKKTSNLVPIFFGYKGEVTSNGNISLYETEYYFKSQIVEGNSYVDFVNFCIFVLILGQNNLIHGRIG